MRKNKFIVVLLSMVMAVCLCFGLAACGDKPDPKPEPDAAKITNGYYDGTYSAGGATQEAWFRFHENGAIMDGKQTFYFQAYSISGSLQNAMAGPMLGVYEILDEQITVKSYPSGSNRDGDKDPCIDRTADKTVVLKSLDGTTEYFRTGWDTKENKLLGIPAVNEDKGITINNNMGVPSYFCNYCYLNKTDAISEKGVEMGKYYANVNEVRNASITIYHNGTYEDNKVTGESAINGTYTKNGNVYTLTAGSGAKGGTLTITDTGATFAVTGADTVTMTITRDRDVSFTFTGSGTSQGVTLDHTLTLYDDYSLTFVSKMGATVVGSSEGTWKEESDASVVMSYTIGTTSGYVTKETGSTAGKYNYETEYNGATLKTEEFEVQVEALYTLTGTITGPDQSGNPSGTSYSATLALNDDLSFSLDLTAGGQTAPAAKGTYAPVMNGQVPTGFKLTVSESSFYSAGAEFTVSITGFGATGIAGLSVELPAATMQIQGGTTITVLNAATLSWSAVTTVYTFTGSLYSGQVTGELQLLSDGSCKYILNNMDAGTGTWTTQNIAGQDIPGSITITVLGATEAETVNVTPDWSNMKLSVVMPAVNQISVTVEYALPTVA